MYVKAALVLAHRLSLPSPTLSCRVGRAGSRAVLMKSRVSHLLPHVAFTCWAWIGQSE